MGISQRGLGAAGGCNTVETVGEATTARFWNRKGLIMANGTHVYVVESTAKFHVTNEEVRKFSLKTGERISKELFNKIIAERKKK